MKNQPITNPETLKTPSLLLSVIPVAFMLTALIAIMVFMGSDAVSSYSHLILLSAAALSVGLSAAAGTLRFSELKTGLRRSSAQTLPAVPLLLLIAMIAATWLLSGVVPTLIDFGLRLLNPTLFLAITCAVCATVSVLTGSSWSTIATIGVAFIGIGRIMGYNEGWIAGAIISGAYFGDKVSPLSDTTVIASSSCGVDLFDHIRHLMITSIPAFTLALVVFGVVGLFSSPAPVAGEESEILTALHTTFNITPWTLVIPLVVFTLIALRVKTIYSLAVSTLLGIAGIFVFQPGMLQAASGIEVSGFAGTVRAVLAILWTDTAIATGNETLDQLVTTGGITGMLPTVNLVLCAMLFGAAMLGTGMLRVIAAAFTRRLRRRTSIVGATVGSGLFLNACTADQYLSIIIGGNMYRDVYSRYSLQPRLLSRTLEDSVSATSVLIPWNSCGVTQSTVLGVATLTYLPFCIFNIASPIMTLIMAWTGFKVAPGKVRKVAS
ncbi:MAG: sodium:proton antiporter [Bacteroides sp.]|nr:sodium:proton antiporter [Bacteroides sp.]